MLSKQFAFVILIALFFASCSSNGKDARPIIAVSLEPQKNILEHIAGDDFRIVSIMNGSDNPETFEPSTSKRIDIENCLVYFSTSLLPFEKRIESASSNKSKFVDTSKGIDLIYGTHSHGNHSHTVADPHVWTSVKNAKIIARNMADKLAEINPQNADSYTKNLDAYIAHLDSLDLAIKNKLAATSGKFIVWHPSLSYFAKDYDLEQVAVSAESKELSVASLADVIERVKGDGINVMFYQREMDTRQAQMIAKSAGIAIHPINVVDYDWENQLNDIANELSNH